MPAPTDIFTALFIVAWLVGVSGWLYGARFHFAVTFRVVRDEPRKAEYRAKAWRGWTVFGCGWLCGMLIGLVAVWSGVWPDGGAS